MTNTQTEEPKYTNHTQATEKRLTEFYQKIWGRYHESTMKNEKRQMPVDKVMVGLGLSALALNSCASFEDTYASRPEAFQRAYAPKETPAELEAKVAGMKKKVDDLKDVNNSLDQLTSIASGETTAEVGVPQKADNNYNSTYLIIAGGVLIAAIATEAIVRYILKEQDSTQQPKKSNPPQNNSTEMSSAEKELIEKLNVRLNRKNPPKITGGQ